MGSMRVRPRHRGGEGGGWWGSLAENITATCCETVPIFIFVLKCFLRLLSAFLAKIFSVEQAGAEPIKHSI